MAATTPTCDLCGLPVLGRPVRDVAAENRAFCCEGCRRVWVAAAKAGIDVLTSGPVDDAGRRRSASARKEAAAARAGARRTTLRINGMWCSSCSLVLEAALLALPGVLDAEVSYAAGLARVTYDPDALGVAALVERVGVLGYHAAPGGALTPPDSRDVRDYFLRFFVSAVVGMWVMWPTLFLLYPRFLSGRPAGLQATELFTGALSLVVLLYGGWPFLLGAWRAARVRRATMDTLVVLGTWTAWGYSLVAALSGGATYFESASMITTIVLLGRWIEASNRSKAATALAGLAVAEPAEVRVVPEGGGLADAELTPAAAVAPGVLLAIRAGERFPADGVVVSGHTVVDSSALTGEPMPVERNTGDEVWAGTIDLAEAVIVRVVRAGTDTVAGRVAALVEDAAFAKSSAQRLADVLAGVFVPGVLAVAAMTLLYGAVAGLGSAETVRRAVSVLVVACPCALGLATPLALLNASAAGAARGLLVRGGEVFERAGQIAVVAFDKTGTLTEGKPTVAGILPATLAAGEATRILDAAAAVEAGAAHPAAAALASAGTSPPPVSDVRTRAGLGVEGTVEGRRVLVGSDRLLGLEGLDIPQPMRAEARAARELGDTVVWVAEGGRVSAGLVLTDPVRPEAADVMARVQKAGVRTAMVSGDAEATCRRVAAVLGITDVHAEVLPNDKEMEVRRLAEAGPVAFIGDGLNDAPALAAADLSVALSSGADLALQAADVVLLGDGDAGTLRSLPYLLTLAKRTTRITRENLGWALSYNAIAIPLAIAGVLTPIWAAAAMVASSLAVVANSLRVRGAG